nr:MAG TPA: hypothetical protein [Caudoviricetes sp.]
MPRHCPASRAAGSTAGRHKGRYRHGGRAGEHRYKQ